MKHLLKVMTDDLDDCYMLYDYAKDAKEDNNQKDMIFFRERAKVRMQQFKDDVKKVHEKATEKGMQMDEASKYLMQTYTDKAEKLEYRIAKLG